MTGIGSFTKSDSVESRHRVGIPNDVRPVAGRRRQSRRRQALGTLIGLLVVSACTAHVSGSASSVSASAPVSTAPQSDPARYVTRILEFTTPAGGRTARVHHPASARPGAPLVVVLHPATVSALDMETTYGWDRIADRFGLVVAYPDGLLDGYGDTWNGGRCCPPASE